MTHPLSRRALLLGAAGLAAGCSVAPPDPSPGSPTPTGLSTPSGTPTTTRDPSPSASPTPGPTASRRPVDPARVKANELGVVPVMMYHRITDEPGEYDMSPGAFRRQLRRLLESGYRPVDADDFAHGRIDLAAGRTPVVLTFDDGSPGQFSLRRDGSLDPGCAAGIIVDECGRVPGALPRATFYVNRAPFGIASTPEATRTLHALVETGFSLGNHTSSHANLATLSDSGVAKELVELQRLVARLEPSARLRTMALPFGVEPRNRRLAARGSWHGTAYDFALILLVGADPSPSPYAKAFDRHAVPRIRGTSWHGGHTPLTGTYWLDLLDAHPERRFVSAGNPGHVTVPKRLRDQVAPAYRSRLVTY